MNHALPTAALIGLATLLGACTKGEGDGLSAAPAGQFQYAVPFTCGPSPAGLTARSLPGQYATVVQVENPTNQNLRPEFGVTLTLPKGSGDGPGDKSGFGDRVTLNPDRAWELDCDLIVGSFLSSPPTSGTLVSGYLLIGSSGRLNVTATYAVGTVDAVTDIQVTPIPAQTSP